MTNVDAKAREYYELMLNALAGLEDDLLANEAPEDAVDHILSALALCTKDFAEKFGSEAGKVGS